MIKVNENTCIGCGACVAIAPENFDFNDAGLSTVISEVVTETTHEAANACPVNAISITASTEAVVTNVETETVAEEAKVIDFPTPEDKEVEEEAEKIAA